MMNTSEKYLYKQSQYYGKHWPSKYGKAPSKHTVFLLKPRQLSASTEDCHHEKCERGERSGTERDKRNRNYSSTKTTREVSNFILPAEREMYETLQTYDLPRCRRRAELTRPHDKTLKEKLKNIEMKYQNARVYQSVSDERSQTVNIEENDANYNADNKERRELRKPKKFVIINPGKKYEPYHPSCNVRSGGLRQMESRYLTQVEHRLYNAINIFVYKNGIEDQSPTLIHIEPHKKNSMNGIMSAIQERVKFPIGYPNCLYTVEGTRLIYAYQLKHNAEYVVATNLQKRFLPLQYGRIRTPLMMMGKQSKHIRNLVHKYEEHCREEYTDILMRNLDVNFPSEGGSYGSDGFLDVVGSKSNFMPKDISERDVATSNSSNDIRIEEISKVEDKTTKMEDMELPRKIFQDTGTNTIQVSSVSVDCIPEKTCHRFNKYMENKSADNFLQRSNYFQGLESTRDRNTKGCQCSSEKINTDYQNPFPSSDNILTASKRYAPKHVSNKKPLKPEYLLNTDEQAYHRHLQRMKGDSVNCQSLYGHYKNGLNESDLKNQIWERELEALLLRKKINNSGSSNCTVKEKVKFVDEMDKGYLNSCPNLPHYNISPQKSQTTRNASPRHNIMYNNAAGDGINKLNYLPHLGYNPSSPPAFIIQPLQLPSANQTPKITVGPSRSGITDPWTQQILLQNQLQNIPAHQIMQLIPPQNFQITPSSYPNLSVPGVQISQSNNDWNTIAQLYAISTSNPHM